VHALLKTGILQKTGTGLIEFPFDTVHVDFTLKPPESSRTLLPTGEQLTANSNRPGPDPF
jgi:hypothetical protein